MSYYSTKYIMKEEKNTEGRRHQSTDEHESIGKKNGGKGRGMGWEV